MCCHTSIYIKQHLVSDMKNQLYKYLGDRLTDPELKGKTCEAVKRENGKCIRGKNGSMVVRFDSGREANVIGRLLRKIKTV